MPKCFIFKTILCGDVGGPPGEARIIIAKKTKEGTTRRFRGDLVSGIFVCLHGAYAYVQPARKA